MPEITGPGAADLAKLLKKRIAHYAETLGAQLGYICILDADYVLIADAAIPPSAHHLTRVMSALAQWAGRSGEQLAVEDTATSPWCRDMGREEPPAAALLALPLRDMEGEVCGAVVVGDPDVAKLAGWRASMAELDAADEFRLEIPTALLRNAQLLRDSSGAYSASYMRELLENELRRASRHGNHFSVVFLEISNHEQLV